MLLVIRSSSAAGDQDLLIDDACSLVLYNSGVAILTILGWLA